MPRNAYGHMLIIDDDSVKISLYLIGVLGV